MLQWSVVARAISKWGRYGFGFALAVVSWLQPTAARAVLMNYTGTFSMQIEGFSNSSQPFYGTADVDLSTGAFQILPGWSLTYFTTGGTFTTNVVAIWPPQTLSGGSVTQHPIAQHPLLSVGGFSQGFLQVSNGIALQGTTAFPGGNNLLFHPGGGFGGGFGGNAYFSPTRPLNAHFVGTPIPPTTGGAPSYVRELYIHSFGWGGMICRAVILRGLDTRPR